MEKQESRNTSCMGVIVACRVITKLLGYELCVLDKEGTLFYSDPIVIIRKEKFTEVFNIQKGCHETGDVIEKVVTREIIYKYILDNRDKFS